MKKTSTNRIRSGGYGIAKVKYHDPLLPWFKIIIYNKSDYVVIDRYTGDQKFIGQSIYFRHKKPVFGFNYYGRVLDKSFANHTDRLFNFLKQALRAGRNSRFRGLSGFKEGGFVYKNKHQVKSGFIVGDESISFKGRIIYRLIYQAGGLEDRRRFKSWNQRLYSSVNLRKDLARLW